MLKDISHPYDQYKQFVLQKPVCVILLSLMKLLDLLFMEPVFNYWAFVSYNKLMSCVTAALLLSLKEHSTYVVVS